MNELLLLQTLAFPVTAALILFFRRYALRFGVVDVPWGRKRHHGEIPLVGGLGMFGGLALIALLTGTFPQHAAFFAAISLLVITGFVDDRSELSPRVQLVLQTIAALIMVYGADVRLDNLGNLFGFGDVTTGRWAVPITVFAILGVINAINMIDGIDGLAGGVALVVLLIFSAFSAAGGYLDLTLLLPLACVIIGFLAFNLPTPWRSRASVFMGNAGSGLLGFSLAWYAVDLTQAHQAFTPITAIWILAIPLMDTIGLIVRRVLKGRSPFAADREHLHHILLRAGYTPEQTVFIVLGLTLMLGAFGIAGWWLAVPEYVMFYSFMALFACTCSACGMYGMVADGKAAARQDGSDASWKDATRD